MSAPTPEVTENQKRVLRILRNKLNGECSFSYTTCPKFIGINLTEISHWKCNDCKTYFTWLAGKHAYISPYRYPCPCLYVPYETLDLRFQELLEEDI